jgi:diacylglycerol kinase (ATP)
VRTWLGRRLRSFGYALRGFRVGTAGPNFRIQLVAGAVVLFLAGVFAVTGAELGLLLVAITLVLGAELTNTAIERLCDFVAGLHGIGLHPRIRDVKDLAAAAVLVAALGAAAIGVTVLLHGR